MDKLKFTLKEVISICAVLLTVAGSWYSLKTDIEELKQSDKYIRTEFTDFKTSVRNNLDLINRRVFAYGLELDNLGITLPDDPDWREP